MIMNEAKNDTRQKKRVESLLADANEVMTREEEHEVFTYYKDHPSQELRNMIAMKNYRLVIKETSHPKRRDDWEDHAQNGFMGLMRAIDTYDPDSGYKFSTYAVPWIKSYIERGSDNEDRMIRIPVHIMRDVRHATNIYNEYKADHKRDPSIDELSKLSGLSKKRLSDISVYRNDTNLLSLDAVTGPQDSRTSYEPAESVVADPRDHDIAEDVDRKVDMERLEQEIQKDLSEKEYYVLCRRLGLDGEPSETLEEIAQKYGVTKERIRQIEEKALRKIRKNRHSIHCEGLQEYQYGT